MLQMVVLKDLFVSHGASDAVLYRGTFLSSWLRPL